MIKRALLIACFLALLILQVAHAETDQRVDTQINESYPALLALYKDLHQHPELGFQEKRTASRLAQEMRRIGFTVTEGVGRTGLVALLENGPGATVMIRTELDALPLEEKPACPMPASLSRLRGRTGRPRSCTAAATTCTWQRG